MGSGFQGKSGGLNKPFEQQGQKLTAVKDINQNTQNNPSNSDKIMVGTNVLHERFGKGKVTNLEHSGADQKAVIFFPHHGSKTMLLSFAKLTIVDE